MIAIVHLFTILFLVLLLHGAAASFKDDCLKLREAQTKSTYVDGRCLIVKISQLLSQADAQQRCLVPSQCQRLAANFNPRKSNTINSLLDLSDGLWTSLILTSNNQTVWFNPKTGKNSSVLNPPWAPGFPDPTRGHGILLRFDGLMNTDIDSKHPALCESFDEKLPGHVRFKGGANLKGSDAILSRPTVTSQHKCGISCSSDPSCQAYAYSSSNGECQLLWLSEGALTLEQDSDYKLLNRAILLVTHLISNPTTVNFESYYPGHSNLNTIFYNSTRVKTSPIAVLVEGKVVVTAHTHYANAALFSQATETIIYNPNTNTLSSGASTVEPRHAPAAAALDQTVVLCGGFSSAGSHMTSCERFSHGQWSLMTASLNAGRWAFRMVNLHNKLYALGGLDTATYVSGVERYDAVSDVWTMLTDPIPTLVHTSGATVFQDEIIFCGGYATSGAVDSCHAYSDITDDWRMMAQMMQPRYDLALVAFHGYIYAFGGADGDRSVEKFDPQMGQWAAESGTIQEYYAAAIVV